MENLGIDNLLDEFEHIPVLEVGPEEEEKEEKPSKKDHVSSFLRYRLKKTAGQRRKADSADKPLTARSLYNRRYRQKALEKYKDIPRALIVPDEKRCTRCGVLYTGNVLEAFGRNSPYLSSLKTRCKKCLTVIKCEIKRKKRGVGSA
jgi:hypothetical protein